ncbi:uncharacterized protein BCR38DRAFT_124498 [Pseudomassariella vexata]|uniref:Uncharacterized protein n=1 Tax=Pseudomassariella vexata TaxID=1141098 RepID=A0A1Y2D8A9_9PEZI|nr:uncharacterized protein BCR38DRAFT_124498 [Pseudomassariella vexata]ORY55457.1 hypothetical protein BCR38DRAFT_124498 [Pseudomassariella vexata]
MSMRQVGLRHNLNLRQGFSLGPASGPHRQAQNVKGFGWNATPVEIQAANSLCDMFRLLIPIKNLSPVTSRGLLRPALAYLDACVFLGLDTPAIREKLNMIVHILTVHGEIWPISRKVADEVREIIKEYIPASSSSHQEIEVSRRSPWALASGADVDVIPNAWLLPDFDLTLYPEFDHLDQWTIQGNENHHINV